MASRPAAGRLLCSTGTLLGRWRRRTTAGHATRPAAATLTSITTAESLPRVDIDVQLHITPCIIGFPPGSSADALLNPANESLCGTLFTPSEANEKLAGDGIIYPPQAVDGMVTELGGSQLWRACQEVSEDPAGSGIRCRPGCAVLTPAFGELLHSFQYIIHTVPPFFGSAEWEQQMIKCYQQALDTALRHGLSSVACPLLGAGARGAPPAQAAHVAAIALASFTPNVSSASFQPLGLRLAVQHEEIGAIWADELNSALPEGEMEAKYSG